MGFKIDMEGIEEYLPRFLFFFFEVYQVSELFVDRESRNTEQFSSWSPLISYQTLTCHTAGSVCGTSALAKCPVLLSVICSGVLTVVS